MAQARWLRSGCSRRMILRGWLGGRECGCAGFAVRHDRPYHAPVRWLLHGTMTSAVGDALRGRGDSIIDASMVGIIAESTHEDVLKAAHKAQLDLMTTDAGVADAVFAPDAPTFGRSIVYLQLRGGDVEQDDAVDRLFRRYKRLTPGRLYTVTGTRVKIRQLPGRK